MSTQKTELNRILEIIGKIVKLSTDGDYIYRGEQEFYGKVSSNLWRELNKLNILDLDVEEVQQRELEEAKRHSDKTDEFEILVELQHFGGKTNLIDFTTDHYIALFFAANGSPDKDGRVILQSKTGKIKDWIRKLPDPPPIERAKKQKSIFVQPPEGFIPNDFIQSDKIIIIPKDLKQSLLRYLQRKEFDISAESLYHDIHGFIRSQDSRWSAYSELKQSQESQDSGDEIGHTEKEAWHDRRSIKHLTNAIKLMSDSPEIYYNRGVAYSKLGIIDQAIADYTTAIKLQPDFAFAYQNRGLAYDQSGEFDRAIRDYDTAIRLNPDSPRAYSNLGAAYVSKNDYERAIEKYSKAIELNPDVADDLL